MERRDFLAATGAATLAAGLAGRAGAQGTPSPAPAPKPGGGFQAADADRYDRPDVHAGDRPVGASFGSRSAVYGCSGAAGTAQPLATLAAIETLKRGGTAADAAIAANAALGFLEPTACGIGGDVYILLWDPKAGKVMALAGSGRSPRSLSLDTVRARAVNGALPPLGAISVSTPGTVDGWWTLHRRYGRLPWKTLFDPAIAMAENGVPFPPLIAGAIRRSMGNFVRPGKGIEDVSNARKLWGTGPRTGEVVRNPDLAATYRAIAENGRDGFYGGRVADAIDAYFKRIGGWLSKDDLRDHRSRWVEPLATGYRGVTVHAIGENTQGLATLQMLNILEGFDLRAAGFQSARAIHLMAEAKRLAYEDRARYYADPEFAKVPFDWLNSKDYAARRRALIRPDRLIAGIRPGQAPSRGDTTYFTTADRDGMMVSIIQSNFRGMGSGLVADGPDGRTLGFMFQDRGQLFSLKDGHPNLYAPGKRPFQTIIPGFATKDGQPWLSFGVMGGDMQPQGQVQVLANIMDYGLDIQAAGDSPRWHHEGSSQSMGEDAADLGPNGLLRLETGVPDATKAALAGMGWTIGGPDGGFGRYECIQRSESNGARVYAAASEMRADGCALAY